MICSNSVTSKHESFEDFLVRIVKFSRHGALMQFFIASALERSATKTINAIYEELGDSMSMVDHDSWKSVARELLNEITTRNKDEHNGSGQT